MNSGARGCGLVGLSAESAGRSTPYLPQIFDMTRPSCHPDISGYGIYDLVIIPPTGYQVVPIAPGPTGGPWQGRLLWAIGLLGVNLGPAAGQSDDRLGEGKGGPIAPGPTAGI